MAHSRTTDLTHGTLDQACGSRSVAACIAFLDQNPPIGEPPRVTAGAFQLVAPREYVNISRANTITARECCRRAKANKEGFFCRPHVMTTLRSQYRFLPALHYLRVRFNAWWTSERLKWMVLTDDDSRINMPNLELLLVGSRATAPRFEAAESFYLGDFGGSFLGAPFACGGSGTVLSRGAMLRTPFDACARRYRTLCAQSDWMVGACARDAGVAAVRDPSISCGLCRAGCRLARELLKNRTGCAFAQLQDAAQCSDLRRPLCAWCPKGLAISHGFDRLCLRRGAPPPVGEF